MAMQDHYWKVGGLSAQVYSSRMNGYVPVTHSDYVAWLANCGNYVSNIANEVELQDVLLRNSIPRVLQRTFTPAEVIAALNSIDHAKTAAVFSESEVAGIDLVGANDSRILAVALQCDGFRVGTLAEPA